MYSYPVFRDGSVNCLTYVRKLFKNFFVLENFFGSRAPGVQKAALHLVSDYGAGVARGLPLSMTKVPITLTPAGPARPSCGMPAPMIQESPAFTSRAA